LHIDLDSNPKRLLPCMRMEDNNLANADSNRIMWMRIWIPKSDKRIMQMRMRILLITTYAFSPPLHSKSKILIEINYF
jgi:hypothetical protein